MKPLTHKPPTHSNYYAFGMEMPNRKYTSSGSYRFGFNGQEKDDEIAGDGNITTAAFWEYDARLGRRWNQDPKPNPSISNYACFANNPIYFTDPNGDTLKISGDADFIKNTTEHLEKIRATKQGRKVIETLENSRQVYTINEVLLVRNSQTDSEKNRIDYDDNPFTTTLDGGALNGVIALAHELYHSYEDDIGKVFSEYTRSDRERSAVAFQNYIT